MDVQRLRFFLAVMDCHHFARAAESLGVSQPAVTQAISKLEKELDVSLFDRGRFGAVPTEFATTLAQRARLVIAELELAKSDMVAMKGAKSGRLSIGVGFSLVPRLAPNTLGEFIPRRPDIALRCEEGSTAQLSPKLLSGDLDLMLVSPPPSYVFHEDIKSIPLFDEVDQLTVREGHPLTLRDTVGLKDLREFPWIVAREMGLWRKYQQVFQDAGLTPPDTLFETTSVGVAINTLMKSDCVAVLGTEISSVYSSREELAILPIDDFTTQRRAYFCYLRRSPLSETSQSFLSILKKHCRKLYGSQTNMVLRD